MVNRRNLIWWVLIVLAVALIWRWAPPPATTPSAVADPQPGAEAAVDTGSPRGEPESVLADARPEPGPRATPSSAPSVAEPVIIGFDTEAFLASIPARLDELTRRAGAGDAQAMAEVADWLVWCDRVEGNFQAWRPGGSVPTEPKDPIFSAYMKRARTLCSEWVSGTAWLSKLRADHLDALARYRATIAAGVERPPQPMRPAAELRARSAGLGDIRAQVENDDPRIRQDCGQGDDLRIREERLRWIVCMHSVLRSRLQEILASRNPLELASVPRIVSAHAGELLNRSEYLRSDFPHAETSDVLWTLAACEFGLDCGATGNTLRMACAWRVCAYAHYRQYASDWLLPPVAMRLVDARLPRLVALIRAGNVDAILGPPPG